MSARILPAEEILALLRIAPHRIANAAAGLSEAVLTERPGPEEWSPNLILAHLRACQDIWGEIRVLRMLTEDHPTMRAVNPMTWLAQTDYRELTFSESLQTFTVQRQRFVDTLAKLSREQWMRGGTFTGGGRPRLYTIHTEADALARHERGHIKQIERLCDSNRV